MDKATIKWAAADYMDKHARGIRGAELQQAAQAFEEAGGFARTRDDGEYLYRTLFGRLTTDRMHAMTTWSTKR